ncbi:MAG TPA: hypothetical protein VJC13_00230 [Candidatus Paceibacterota bacterium]|nr:hypothetical protein [uncultured archaeon]
MRYSIFLLLIVFSFGLFNMAVAQVGTDLNKTVVDVTLTPENPKPLGQAYLSLTSYGTDLNSANITWNINGKTLKTGVGEKNFSFTVGDINTTTVVDIIIKTKEGEIVNKTLNIKPSAVDLIWQAEAFVPPFYKGKTLFSHQDYITFIAIPHIISPSGSEFPTNSLIYKWKKNGTVIDYTSGFGKNTYSFTGPLISRPFTIEVEVTTQNTDDVGYASTSVQPVDPSILFYAKNPIYGIQFQKALQGSVNLNPAKEINVVAMPYFFGSLDPTSSALTYKWAINGAPINNGNLMEQVFRHVEGTSGTSNISLSIENSSKILQYASQSFALSFGK